MTSPNSEYSNLDIAFSHFNTILFGGELPGALLTIHKHPRAKGYFRRSAFTHRINAEMTIDEICLCPDAHTGRTDLEILSTLVHEQCHLWQFHFGTPPRRCYHDREFATKMEGIGLMPSDTGMEGGKKTGQSMTHYVIEGGAFDIACRVLLATGWSLQWEEPTFFLPATIGGTTNGTGNQAKVSTRKKFNCPACKLTAYTKFDAKLVCGTCMVAMA